MDFKPWQQWGFKPELESKHNEERLKGKLADMESTKQLVDLISEVYESGMKVLDVGCNIGHYLKGIRKKFPLLEYTGVDAYDYYITKAKEGFSDDPHAKFEVKDVFEPLYPDDPYDVVFCCNVIVHLPDFRKPVSNLLQSTMKTCFIRTPLGDNTTIVKASITEQFDEEGNPLNYWYINTWNRDYFIDFIKKLGWNTELIHDKFDSSKIQNEYESIKSDKIDLGTYVVGGKQMVNNILLNWEWIKITKK